ncbi:MAG: flavoprotein family protein [Bacteroidetes bacterium]|nr:flavoprotein family protein [Bacteroidota bacterium]
MNIAIIGGGAAGFFLAINLKQLSPNINVTIFEKNTNVLAKVLVSGGGRCNLTNSFAGIDSLHQAYPRGDKLLKRAFRVFSHLDTYKWFEDKGIKLVTQEDDCVFPLSQNSNEIIECFIRLSKELGISVKTSLDLSSITFEEKYALTFNQDNTRVQFFDAIAITTGGSPKAEGLNYLEALGHKIVPPVPSLFTFNIPEDPIRELMGIVAENTIVSLQGTNIKASGALLITHWGMSGPAILKLSSYGARLVNDKQYRFNILVNWVNEVNCDILTDYLNSIACKNPNMKVSNVRPYDISSRLWLFLLNKAEIPLDRKWGELGKKGINKIMNRLSNDEYSVHGKGSFRDEFVTSGGVSLESINFNTMESKSCKNLYFAGEVLDIDAITGGFNLQAAWTTAYIAAKAITQQ